MSHKPLIAVVGETASGKSDLAMEIARRHDGELICADSRTVYIGMDIGTAKPTKQDQAEIPHYGLDLVEPSQRYTAAQFKEYAQGVISDIQARGKLPILVGGTGLYVSGVLYDYSFGGQIDEELRSQLNNKSVDELTIIAEKEGLSIDESIKLNKRYLIRLIERDGETDNNTELKYDTLILGLTLSRTQLRKRAEDRVEKMFKLGLRKEYNDLRTKYDPNTEAFTGIGYREFTEWEAGNASMSEVKRNIVKNTMKVLAKHQRTWFKRDKNIVWVESAEEGLVHAARFLENE